MITITITTTPSQKLPLLPPRGESGRWGEVERGICVCEHFEKNKSFFVLTAQHLSISSSHEPHESHQETLQCFVFFFPRFLFFFANRHPFFLI